MEESNLNNFADMPLHLQLSLRRAELTANEMTWEQLHAALLNLYQQRLLEIQVIKDMLQEENIEVEFDLPTDMELAHLALSMMKKEDLGEEEDGLDDDILFY